MGGGCLAGLSTKRNENHFLVLKSLCKGLGGLGCLEGTLRTSAYAQKSSLRLIRIASATSENKGSGDGHVGVGVVGFLKVGQQQQGWQQDTEFSETI